MQLFILRGARRALRAQPRRHAVGRQRRHGRGDALALRAPRPAHARRAGAARLHHPPHALAAAVRASRS